MTENAVKIIAEAIFNVRDDEFDLDEWDDLDATERERYECYARAAIGEMQNAGILFRERSSPEVSRRGKPMTFSDRPKFTLTGSDGAVYEFIVCAGCGCLISYTDQHPCHDGAGPR